MLNGRRVVGPLVGEPDQAAALLIGLWGSEVDGVAVLHSTSWRWDGVDGLLLTYLCCPDPRPDIAIKTISNWSNHLFETPVDDIFAVRSWSIPERD